MPRFSAWHRLGGDSGVRHRRGDHRRPDPRQPAHRGIRRSGRSPGSPSATPWRATRWTWCASGSTRRASSPTSTSGGSRTARAFGSTSRSRTSSPGRRSRRRPGPRTTSRSACCSCTATCSGAASSSWSAGASAQIDSGAVLGLPRPVAVRHLDVLAAPGGDPAADHPGVRQHRSRRVAGQPRRVPRNAPVLVRLRAGLRRRLAAAREDPGRLAPGEVSTTSARAPTIRNTQMPRGQGDERRHSGYGRAMLSFDFRAREFAVMTGAGADRHLRLRRRRRSAATSTSGRRARAGSRGSSSSRSHNLVYVGRRRRRTQPAVLEREHRRREQPARLPGQQFRGDTQLWGKVEYHELTSRTSAVVRIPRRDTASSCSFSFRRRDRLPAPWAAPRLVGVARSGEARRPDP